jgi:SAM-dependent methyltransferase
VVVTAPAQTVVWHDIECGAYRADLALWRELADDAAPRGAAAVLDIGAGSGRVALDLARRGHDVTALDRDGELLGALDTRAAELGLRVARVTADAREFAIARRDFDLCLVPMQTIQLLESAAEREALLACAHAHMRAGALLACAIVTELDAFDYRRSGWGPQPEQARVGAREYVSRAVRVGVQRRTFTIERERRILEPEAPDEVIESSHDLVRLARISAAGLWRAGRGVGLTPAGTRTVPATSEHVGSEVVLLRA